MTDPRIVSLAKTLVNYSVGVQPAEKVLLTGSVTALPLVVETYREIIRAGGFPFLQLADGVFSEILLGEANEDQLRHIPPPLELVYETYDCFVNIRGTTNTRSLSGIAPDRQRIQSEATSRLAGRNMERSAEGSARWVVTLFPTNAQAQEADMSLSAYEDFVYQACLADTADPVHGWMEVRREQQRLVDWLKGKRQVTVKGPDIDLSLSIEERTFVNADGSRNMPDGEIFTGPVEDSVNGWVKFSYPAIYSGREVSGVELVFEDGRVTKATAEKNEAVLLQMLAMDAGASYLGEFAIGTNKGIQQFTKSILYDEKIGGTVHMALGRGYPETGSKNVSGLHWDMICDMRDGGVILVDGELFYESGEFKI